MPSPVAGRPGLLIRDPYHSSDMTLIVPPVLVQCLQCFDGEQTDLDVKALLTKLTGELEVSDVAAHLIDTLSRSGFLENEAFERVKDAREREFAAAPKRDPSHAGSAYPEELAPFPAPMGRYMGGEPGARQAVGLGGIGAPH